MVRKQIYLKPRQIQAIQVRADALGVSESELIRRAIDKDLSGGSSSFYPDPEAFQKLKDFLAAFQPASKGRPRYQFNRDEIYEDRLDRHADPDR